MSWKAFHNRGETLRDVVRRRERPPGRGPADGGPRRGRELHRRARPGRCAAAEVARPALGQHRACPDARAPGPRVRRRRGLAHHRRGRCPAYASSSTAARSRPRPRRWPRRWPGRARPSGSGSPGRRPGQRPRPRQSSRPPRRGPARPASPSSPYRDRADRARPIEQGARQSPSRRHAETKPVTDDPTEADRVLRRPDQGGRSPPDPLTDEPQAPGVRPSLRTASLPPAWGSSCPGTPVTGVRPR